MLRDLAVGTESDIGSGIAPGSAGMATGVSYTEPDRHLWENSRLAQHSHSVLPGLRHSRWQDERLGRRTGENSRG